ncbi:MAG: hypothetical protein AAGK74_00010, partial [Chloroflexota bacterium]
TSAKIFFRNNIHHFITEGELRDLATTYYEPSTIASRFTMHVRPEDAALLTAIAKRIAPKFPSVPGAYIKLGGGYNRRLAAAIAIGWVHNNVDQVFEMWAEKRAAGY